MKRLTFGAFCKILDIKLPSKESKFWNPHIIRDLGFATADREYKRFLHYLEISPHIEKEAWDPRNIWIRVPTDIRRDFAHHFSSSNLEGAFVDLGQKEVKIERFYDRLSELKRKIDAFEELLNTYGEEKEKVFHDFLEENPVLLDVYGEPISKPQFSYPDSEKSPIGKNYVEPDFIIKYPDNNYKLVELENPSKKMSTKQGHPRSEVTQATFQIAEWKHYIFNHYEILKNRFPGISNPSNCSSMVVISRARKESFDSKKELKQYMELVNSQYSCEVIVYEDLLKRAKTAYSKLCNLNIKR